MKRLQRVMEKLAAEDIAAFYITGEKNIRYLTGFTGEESHLLILKDQAIFLTDGRYTDQAKAEIPAEIDIRRWKSGLILDAQAIFNESGLTEVFFESEYLTYPEGQEFVSGLKIKATPLNGFVEAFRAVKDQEEIAATIEAVRIVDKTFMHILNFIRPGISEREVAAEMEYFMKKAGSENVSFDTIVASGVRSSLPHGAASSKLIEKGDLVTLDFGATYKGYVSDITRTIAVGQVDPRLEELYAQVLEAQSAGLTAIRAGLTSKELDQTIRRSFIEKDMNQYFIHGAGHSIGLDIHEAPFISKNSDTAFKANMIQTIEPGLYLKDLGGVRIEDDILVQDGPGIILTQSPKQELIHLPFY